MTPNKIQPNNDCSTDTDDDLERTLSNNLRIITDELNTAVGTACDCMKAISS